MAKPPSPSIKMYLNVFQLWYVNDIFGFIKFEVDFGY